MVTPTRIRAPADKMAGALFYTPIRRVRLRQFLAQAMGYS